MVPRRLWGTLVLALAACVFLSGAALAQTTLNINVGESASRALAYQFSRVAVGDPSVADYTVVRNVAGGSEILVNGKRPGTTNLIVWDASGQQRDQFTIRVLVGDLKAFEAQIRALMGPAPGLTMRAVSGKLLIEGEVPTPRDVQRIKGLVGESPQVAVLVNVSQDSLNIIAQTIQKSINDPAITARPINQRIALEGMVHTKERLDRAMAMAKLYFDDVVSLLEVRQATLMPGPADTIQITAHLMEVSLQTINGWGIRWFPGSDSNLQYNQDLAKGAGFTGAIFGTIKNLFPRLSSAHEAGGAKILETSSMSVRSGDKAEFWSGGEVALPVSQASGSVTLVFKSYGVFLKVLPISQAEKISMDMEMEVSAPSTPVSGNFNFSRSVVKTVQFCASGDSIAIGGLVSSRDTKLFDELPTGASDALFQLYHSEDFRRKRSEFVVFVTPAVIKGGAVAANQDIKSQVEKNFKAYLEDRR